MVLTDRQRTDLHSGIYEYLLAQAASGEGATADAFSRAAAALHEADPDACSVPVNGSTTAPTGRAAATPLLEKKWVTIPRLQKKVMELERLVAQSAKIHAHRSVSADGDNSKASNSALASAAGGRRMLPRQPYLYKLQGHSAVVTCVAVHPVFTLAASGSEDGTIKVRRVALSLQAFIVVRCVSSLTLW
jgi:platelet-activating factor acetylhydrolase IB subunit alpha